MTTTAQILIVLLILALVAGAALLLWREGQTRRLRRQFGPEYDRALERHNSRSLAERELRDRERRHEQLDIRPLDPAVRDRHRQRWARIQEEFVDQPRPAVEHADALVTSVMAERGYPTQSYAEQTASLSVDHARTLDHYRRGHDIGTRATGGVDVSTEDLRQAMVHYRALFDDLLDLPDGERAPTTPGRPATPAGEPTGPAPDGRPRPADTDQAPAGGRVGGHAAPESRPAAGGHARRDTR